MRRYMYHHGWKFITNVYNFIITTANVIYVSVYMKIKLHTVAWLNLMDNHNTFLIFIPK
jgi:hypothetical protein